MQIPRTVLRSEVDRSLRTVPAVALIGARQVGKTTLARSIRADWDGASDYFDLERPQDLARLSDPELALRRIDGLVVLDESHHRPEIFGVLRGLIDRHPGRRFLVLGSASIDLLRQGPESLAGRIAFHEVNPFGLHETGADTIETLWLRGGFPRSFLAEDDDESFRWRLNFIRTFVERDLPSLGLTVPSATHDRFWRMLSHVHGQTWNASRFASSFGPVSAARAKASSDHPDQVASSVRMSNKTLLSTSVPNATSAAPRERHDLVGRHAHVATAPKTLGEFTASRRPVGTLAHDDGVTTSLKLDFGTGADSQRVPKLLWNRDLTPFP